jgi:N-acetylneuraminate synthase
VFVIAEAGVNHNGDVALAKELIDVACAAGADAVKFQTFRAEAIAAIDAPKASYQLATTSSEQSQFEMLRQLELSKDEHHLLKDYCCKKNITFLSTPFDPESADFLETLDVPAFKISSGDLTNTPLLQHVARKKKPVILSTGMATLQEVKDALTAINETGNDQVILLQCVSQYPASPGEVNLRAMETMRRAFNVPIGFSDHTEGIAISLAAVALGAVVIEKHFTLDRNLPGPDHRASLEPEELQALISGIRSIEAALGDGEKKPSAAELKTASVARRSIVAAQTIQAGAILSDEEVVLKRPGTGLPPSMLKSVVGKRVRRNIPAGTMIDLEMLE